MELAIAALTGILIVSIHIITCGAAGEKSARKCMEYARAVYINQDSPVLSRRIQDKVSECGIIEVPLIIGGVRTRDKEFPHMAAIGFQSPSGTIKWLCGGTLISDTFVLTAAHCTLSPEYGPAKYVLLGTLDTQVLDDTAQRRNVAERIAHPSYKPPSKYNDIALLRLDRPVSFSGYVRPACLNTKNSLPNRKAIATGFGKESYDATEGSRYLLKVQLDFIGQEECRQKYYQNPTRSGLPEGLKETMLCVGVVTGGKDTCQGDSGGPLQVVLEEPYCMYSIVGVTSFGKFCGMANSPSIYTKVASYVPWIESIVWP